MRFTHYAGVTPEDQPWSGAYDQGQSQASISIQRYHFLRAAATHAYELRLAPTIEPGELAPLTGIYFPSYTAYNLKPIEWVKMRPLPDGTVAPGDMENHLNQLFSSWKNREGGVLYYVMDTRPFWNVIENWHSVARTTGFGALDMFLERWMKAGFGMGMLPCMFFARESGCLDPKCPFKHDRDACMREREKLLTHRRASLGKPTPEDVAAYSTFSTPNLEDNLPAFGGLYGDDGYLSKEIHDWVSHGRVRVCWNTKCANNERAPPGIQLKACTRCKVVTYCSLECQKKNWKVHKKDCYPFEQIIEDDELWTILGFRKGTNSMGAVTTTGKGGAVSVTFPGASAYR